MKRILLPAGGAILATGLLAAGLAGAANAAPDEGTLEAHLAQRAAEVQDTINFWTKSNNEALRQATAFHYDYKAVKKIVQKGGYNPDGKPGVVPAIGEEKKAAVKVHNVNLPKTIGKVFFQTRDGKLYWCSGTSIQSNYKNLVATAGHCVYEDLKNEEVVSRWVFVPMYYQGKTPAGIYVGKQAFTHYDFTTYEDYDRDYAFVTVYDGIKGGENGETTKATELSKSEFLAYKGSKYIKESEIKEADAAKTLAKANELAAKYNASGKIEAGYTATGEEIEAAGPVVSKTVANPADKVADNYVGDGKVNIKLEVNLETYNAAVNGNQNGNRYSGTPQPEIDFADLKHLKGLSFKRVTESEYNAFVAAKNAGQEPNAAAFTSASGKVKIGDKTVDFAATPGGYWIVRTYVNQWYKQSSTTTYYFRQYFKVELSMAHVGRLGDNVGGQGFAWNQPTGKYVRTFGYPFAQHPDGSKPYSGVTPKWCYGKTQGKGPVTPSTYKVEEQIALKCAVTGGYDGGPWLLKYSNAKRLGYLNGITSLFLDNDGNGRIDNITSAYFDGETALVYNAAKNVASGKILP
ncbi:hypothetical protein ACIBG7_22875 [Nonomuraea sp. NPDC050328]|uniref:hypothetical protein n=1 Tax=Nonomuraea sp. NPDC050328 TaxID=3364361 RepID=UPI0037A5BAC2